MSPIVKYANLTLLFLGGFIVSGFFTDIEVVASTPYLAMLGAFLGIIINRTKHLDDLNMTRKKDVSLDFIEAASAYGAVLVSLIDENITRELFFSDLDKTSKKFVTTMNKFHVVCSDDASSKIEPLHFKLNELMIKMVTQASHLEAEADKLQLMRWFIANEILSQLDDIRFKIIDTVNNEIGDGTGTKKFKKAVVKNNTDYTNMLSKILEKAAE